MPLRVRGGMPQPAHPARPLCLVYPPSCSPTRHQVRMMKAATHPQRIMGNRDLVGGAIIPLETPHISRCASEWGRGDLTKWGLRCEKVFCADAQSGMLTLAMIALLGRLVVVSTVWVLVAPWPYARIMTTVVEKKQELFLRIC